MRRFLLNELAYFAWTRRSLFERLNERVLQPLGWNLHIDFGSGAYDARPYLARWS